MTTPLRRMTLHFSQIALTLGRTFIVVVPASNSPYPLLVPVSDPPSTQVVGRDLYLHSIAGEDPDPVHAHFAGAVRKHLVAVLELDTEHRIRERLDDRSLEHDRILFGLGQVTPPRTCRMARRASGRN
jgi:hypothetical protein